MRNLALKVLTAACLLALPVAATAQTSTIAGEVRDSSGAVLPGVTVEASSPVLIERTRSVQTDSAGRYSIVQLRPGTYVVTFTLPGFSVVKRENVELTSDFTATINADLRVGAVEETITVQAESPIVDVQSITTRTVMTREVLDMIPTGRNIQAVGIMIPGTTLSVGGGNALSRDVGGSGNLQQSPLQYRGSSDTVQTIEGIRLNNLCANGAYSGVYWNDGSFQEISYVTGADSSEMGQGGVRVSMVPKDGGNAFRGTIMGSFTGDGWSANNLGDNLVGDLTFNPSNRLTNVSEVQKIWDFNPSIGGPIVKDKVWFTFTFRHWGVEKTVAGSYFDADPSPFRYVADTSRPAVDDGHIVSRAGRLAWQITSKDKLSVYHDDQSKYRNHWGIAATVPPDASAVQVTPTSFVNVTRWTRNQNSRLMLDAGIGIYDQEYTELYQPEVLNGFSDKVWNDSQIIASRVYSLLDTTNNLVSSAWNAPADHFSLLRTYSASASYVTGSHSFKLGATVSEGNWRLLDRFTGDTNRIRFNGGAPLDVRLRLPTDRRNGIKADTGMFAQDRWAMNRATLNVGLRWDWFIGETQESSLQASRINNGATFTRCADGKNDLKAGCTGTVQNWKDLSPRVGVAFDLFGDGRTALKTGFARYVAGQQIAVANANNPVTTLGLEDSRPWTDIDRNGSPYDANGNIQFNELTNSAQTPTFGKNVSTTSYDPSTLEGWGKRGYNWEYTLSVQHQLRDRISIGGGYFRRWLGNQTFTDDLRYDKNSYDGPFCVTAPQDVNLPGGGGYQVCNLYDLKPGLQNLTPNSLVRFSNDFGGETNIYQGIDFGVNSRFANGAFLQAGIGAAARTFNNCNLQNAGYDAVILAAPLTTVPTEVYADGTSGCDRHYPFRPDMKMLGSYPLGYGVVLSGTYQFNRGVQTGAAGLSPSILATWAVPSATIQQYLGRGLTGAATKNVDLIREGYDYGDQNLNQLDLRASKRFDLGRYRVRVDADLYNAFNSNWPFTLNANFSNANTSAWLRPTNVLQGRMFKLGGQFDF
jgi:carboxypeptidase family protein